MNKWNITKTNISGVDVFAVYRLRDSKSIDRSGNRVLATEYMKDKQEAVSIAERLLAEAEV